MKIEEHVMDLTNESIRKAIDICIKENGYKVIIACTNKSLETTIEVLRCMLRNTKNVEKHVYNIAFSGDRKEVRFYNGSFIKIINDDTKARGYRIHSLLVDEDIPSDIVDCVLKPYLVDESRFRG